ncbi:site-2 protease family protein [Chlorogloeopsis fritschii PCC 9212]|uniref:Zinc metalloprotease n=1 Tax=Chlorogloeopsis fritschii PCC 6912 TaxID=211165 RepID=A0A433NRP6_CHLFR|nr:site-2 protease family protein [Chlorogloeopsis fritschii]RUR86870.1 zinc metalloprotease [Chlorogloeopsis fritschii PCC 6912]
MFINTLLTHPTHFFRVVLIVIISVTLHELAHGFTAVTQGDDTPKKSGHLTLNPVVHMGWESIIFLCLVGIAWGKMPVNPSKFRSAKLSNILVSAAGPISNLALAILCLLLLKFIVYNYPNIFSFNFFYLAARINLLLCLFNLLPIPPLDGFHVFSEIFPSLKPLEKSQYGYFALMMLFLIPQFGDGLGAIADFVMSVVLFK